MVKNSKKIPIKNYIYLSLIIIFSIVLVYYMYLWFIEYDKEQNKTTTIDNVMQIINYNELNTYLVENKNAIIYASITQDKEIKRFEKKFEKLIKEENITNQILYLDITNNQKQNDTYKILDVNITVPVILVYENGTLVNKYEISENNYNIKKLNTHLTTIGVINND